MTSLRRRRFLAVSGLGLAGLAGCSGAPSTGGGAADDGDTGGDTDDGTTADAKTTSTAGDGGTTASNGPSLSDARVGLERLATGFTSPVDFVAPAGTDRRFVVDQPGVVCEVTGDGRRSDPYLDLRDRVVDVSGYDERGLLGVAAHPEFADNGRLFVRYSAPRREGTPSNYSHTFVLSEFTVDPGATTASAADERVLLEVPEPQGNHNAGTVAFGPDSYLYVGVGDGGGANDVGRGHVEDWYDAVEGGNGQDVTENLLGSVLRIDVDSSDEPYGVPDDNPLVGRDGLDEQYAWGFRNPWRMSFDDEDLYVADVGQNAYEEVSLVERGGNYGWNVREGTHCFRAEDCPTETPDGDSLRAPVIEYPHRGDGATGIAVIGGYVYRGDDLPGLGGAYLFADWQAQGRLFAADPGSETTPWPVAEVPVDGSPGLPSNVLAFGRDPAGALYVLTSEQSRVSGNSGSLFRLVAP
jgi:glucose/arabinose dehydrogenase